MGSKNTLLRIEFDVVCFEFSDGLLKVSYELVSPFGLDHDVVHVGLNCSPDEVPETPEHTTLVHSPSVLQTEPHYDIVELSERGDERCRELIRLFHRNLMVPGVRIKEAKGFAP